MRALVAVMLSASMVGAGGIAHGADQRSTATTKPGSFQALYLVAADQTAKSGMPAAIRHDLNKVNAWYSRQTVDDKQPRWVRRTLTNGSRPIVVKTIRLPRKLDAYQSSGDADTLIGADLADLGWPKAGARKLVAFIDASSSYCGRTSTNLTLITMATCNIYPAKTDTWPYGATYLIAHEMTHNFGAVPACAPHEDGTGHVNDDPRDVLYQGTKSRDWDHIKLDPGHDDYYATGRTDCRDIKHSRYWTTPPN